MNTTDRIRSNAAHIAEQNKAMQVNGWDTISVGDIQVGDFITALGNVTFPFPFEISTVRNAGRSVVLTATHGWFTMRPVAKTDTAVRVA